MLTESDLGWVAGLIDLKGKTLTKSNSQRATPQVVMWIETRQVEW